MEFILASQSPRRKDILQNAGYKFTVITVNVSESFKKNLTLDDQIIDIAKTKGQAVASAPNILKQKEYLILSADTVVILDEVPYGKPKNRSEAIEIIGKLNGKTHCVKTGVCFIKLPSFQVCTGIETSWITFKKLSNKDIEKYVSTGEWVDKAGGYAIQGQGSSLVASVEGSMTNIIGLPLELVQKLMRENGWEQHCR